MSYLPLFFFFTSLLMSAILHEYAHAWAADKLGDPTAKYAGRLTLDPRKHIDMWGTILMPLFLFLVSGGSFLFAYAKPVPYNPYNLKDQKWGPVYVAIAGPLSNFSLALVFGLLIRLTPYLSISKSISEFFAIIVYANVLLGVFNMIPIPPLDGSKLLYALLPDSMAHVKETLERYGFFILLIFIFSFSRIVFPIILKTYGLFTNQAFYLLENLFF
ncbi:MAG: site-2 protease family protein [Candidatus Magasanikbacteria bacterium]|nr:site-2 protease family protein [Candidatus Magasanikbacteria bacterium]